MAVGTQALALMAGPKGGVAEKRHRAPSAHAVKWCSLCLELPAGRAELPGASRLQPSAGKSPEKFADTFVVAISARTPISVPFLTLD
jgi:hypothetical protein